MYAITMFVAAFSRSEYLGTKKKSFTSLLDG